MVKRSLVLDSIFGSLSDPTRRDILRRVAQKELSVSEVAKPYNVSLAAVSKHLSVLERAKLIEKRRDGKVFFVRLTPQTLMEASEHLAEYKKLWEARLDRLEEYLQSIQ